MASPKATKSYGSPVAVVVTRPRKCGDKPDGSNCGNKTRLAIVCPVRDPGEEPYMACISMCSECIEPAIISLSKVKDSVVFPFVSYDLVDEAILEAIKRLTIKVGIKDDGDRT